MPTDKSGQPPVPGGEQEKEARRGHDRALDELGAAIGQALGILEGSSDEGAQEAAANLRSAAQGAGVTISN
jgi:hypothetical protein